MNDFREFITRTLTDAAKIANASFGKVEGMTKPDDNNQVLTQTDLDIGKYIVSEIENTFPDHSIIDEEAGVINKNSDYVWTIDPIDGTSNFAAGIPLYGVMLGLLFKDQPYAGGIALPYFNELVTAQRGQGSWKGERKLSVTKEQNLQKCLFTYQIDANNQNPTETYDECKIYPELVLSIRNLRQSGSIAWDGILIVEGKMSGTMNKTAKIWDSVAPQIIIEEAGGICTDFYGKNIDYSNAVNNASKVYTHCLSAPQFHNQLLKLGNT